MNKLLGAPIDTFDLSGWTRVADLSSFDGPLVSLFQSKAGENYIFTWADREKNLDRWLVCQVTNDQLERYLRSQDPLKHLLMHPKPGYLFAVDMQTEWRPNGATVLAPFQLPSDYVPEEDSFYQGEAQLLAAAARFSIPIDLWGYEDLYRFPRLLRQGYAFVCHFVSHISSTVPLPSFPMRDGFSSMHFFRELADGIPEDIALSFQGMRYASPGSIVFEGRPEITELLFSVLLNLKQDTGGEMGKSYRFLHSVLADKKLLGQDVQNVSLDDEVDRHIKRLTADLLGILGLPNPERIFGKCSNTLTAAKVALAFYRLLEDRLLEYERAERIAIPTVFRLAEFNSASHSASPIVAD